MIRKEPYNLSIKISIADKDKALSLSSSKKESNRSFDHNNPFWERWIVASRNISTGNYNLKDISGSRTLKAVVNISKSQGTIENNEYVLVGYYEQDRSRPFLIRTLNSSEEGGDGGIVFNSWTHRHRTGERISRDFVWNDPFPISRTQMISGMFEPYEPRVRVWMDQIYLNAYDTVILMRMGNHREEFYDYMAGQYIGESYALEGAQQAPLGYTVTDFILDPNSGAGDFTFLWFKGISRASRIDLTTIWSTVRPDTGHNIISGSLFATSENLGYLSSKGNRLNMLTYGRSDGVLLSALELTQTAETAVGLAEGETIPLLSGGTYDNILFGADTFFTYWDPASLPTRTAPLSPWGFTNGTPVSSYLFGTYTGERRYGISEDTMPDTSFNWGEAATDETKILHFGSIDGVLQSGSNIVPRPGKDKYLPSLIAYGSDGSIIWEVKGWESSPPEFTASPYRFRDFFSPALILGDNVYCVTLRLTFKTIDENFVGVDTTVGQWTNNPYSPDYNPSLPSGTLDGPAPGFLESSRISITTHTYSFQTPVAKRSRRVVGVQTFFEVFSLENGVRTVSEPLMPQVESQFVTRGTHKGIVPARHGVEAFYGAGSTRPNSDVTPHLGYITSSYWPTHSTYFSLLEAGDYYAYGLYSNSSNRVSPIWPVAVGKPGLHQDTLEGDPFYDPLNNNGYDRIRGIPYFLLPKLWGVKGDKDNSGATDDYINIPPPSAWLYDTVLNDIHYDMPHVSDFFNPLMNSTLGTPLLIFPPIYGLDSSLGTGVLPGKKFAFASGSNAYYSWSGGTVANRMAHSITPIHDDFKTNERQIWRAYDLEGNIAWTHFITGIGVTEFQFARPCCGGGYLHIVYRLNNGPLRIRIVKDDTGVLESDEILVEVDPPLPPDFEEGVDVAPTNLPDGDNGGAPHEVILSGDVSILTTSKDVALTFGGPPFFEVTETTRGEPYIHGLYNTSEIVDPDAEPPPDPPPGP